MELIRKEPAGTTVYVTDEIRHGILEFEKTNGYASAVIFTLFVDERFRKHGVATNLIQRAEAVARNIGCRTLEIALFPIIEQGPWLRLWLERIGYHEADREGYVISTMCKYL
jgi:GNAT superfamily N-acetyltransferase